MHYLNFSIARSELQKVAKGQKSRVPIRTLIEYTLNYCMTDAKPEPLQNDKVRWLKLVCAGGQACVKGFQPGWIIGPARAVPIVLPPKV